MPEALPELIPLVVEAFCIALIWLVRIAVAALLGFLIATLGSIPIIGGAVKGVIKDTENAISHALGKAEHAVDKAIGATWHFFTRLNEWIWREIKLHAGDVLAVAQVLVPALASLRQLWQMFHSQTRTATHTGARVKTLEREYHGIERELKHIERELSKGIGEDVLPRVKTLEREVATVEHQTIPRIRSDVATVEGDITALADWVQKNTLVAGSTALVGAVAWALGKLGASGITCRSFGNLFSKWSCGLWSVLDGLLGLVVSSLLLTHVCDFLPVLEAAFGDVVGPLVTLLVDVPIGACETPPSGWAALNVATGPLPPAQTLGALPA
jgi:hypothetical protein